jgi:AraC family transcriptional regulator
VEVGYRSPDVFARAFKRHFGCTPSQFDLEQWWSGRPDRDAAMSVSRYFLRPAPPLPEDFRVEIGHRPAADLIVSRSVGGYLDPGKLIAAYERIRGCGSAGWRCRCPGGWRVRPRMIRSSLRCRAVVMTSHSRCRRSTAAPKGLHAAFRPEGRWAMVRVVGDFPAVDRAWNLLFKSWLPASGLALRAAPAEELYHQTPQEIGWERFDLTLALPLEN